MIYPTFAIFLSYIRWTKVIKQTGQWFLKIWLFCSINIYIFILGNCHIQRKYARAGCDTRIQSFFSPRSVTMPRLKSLVGSSSQERNSWMYTFSKGISAMWNANNLVQDLNSCYRVHFLQSLQLYHEYLLNVCIYLNPPHEQGTAKGRFFMRGLTGFNSEFSF